VEASATKCRGSMTWDAASARTKNQAAAAKT
jgi:hypothetical protein